jgi:hypothetical protein
VRNYCAVEDVPSLAWVANLGTIELHAYHFDAERPDEPTLVALDLDPGPGAGLLEACRAGLLLRELLDDLGLEGCPKTSAGAGIHVYVPLGLPHAAERTRELARRLAATLAAEQSDLITDDPRAPARRRKVLVDWLQSEPRRSTVAPYSLRATDLPACPPGSSGARSRRRCGAATPGRFGSGRPTCSDGSSAAGTCSAPRSGCARRWPAPRRPARRPGRVGAPVSGEGESVRTSAGGFRGPGDGNDPGG